MSTDPIAIEAERLLADAGWLRSLARTLVRDESLAEDLTQETLLAALRRPPSHEQPLRPWLAHVLRNFARQRYLRERARRSREESTAHGETLPGPDELVERADAQRALAGLVLELSEPYRSVVLLRYFEGLAPEEIARRREQLGSTVRSQLTRGLQELRRRLDARHGGDRRAWIAALVPLAGADAVTQTAAGVSATAASGGLIALGAGFAAIAALAGWALFGDRAALASDDVPGVAVAVDTVRSRGRREEAGATVAGERVAVDASPAGALVAAEAPVRGVVRHHRTGEPLPDFALELRGDGRRERVITDAAGRFESARAWSAGPLALHLLDHLDGLDRRSLAIEHVPGRELEVLAPSGATFELDLVLPTGLAAEDLYAVLIGTSYWQSIRASMVDRAPPIRLRPGSRSSGPLPWVRFDAESAATLGAGGPWRIDVASADGLWHGYGQAPVTEGRASAPVRIEVRAAAALRGWLRYSDGSAPRRARVFLNAVGAAQVALGDGRKVQTQTLDDAAYAFRGIPPGRYVLHARASDRTSAKQEITVSAGTTGRVDVDLGPPPDLGALRGVLASRTGNYGGAVTVRAYWSENKPAFDAEVYCELEAEWTGPPGARLAHFEFADLPEGEYRVQIRPKDQRRWTPTSAFARTDGAPLEFLCDDGAVARDLHVRARDAETGAPLPSIDASAIVAGGTFHKSAVEAIPAGGRFLAGVPDDMDLEWSVRVPGYAAVHGGREELREDGDRLWIDVELERGWAGRVFVFDPRYGVGLPGAEVYADGVRVGRADARGYADVALDARPARLTATFEDWRQWGSTLVTSQGEFPDNVWFPVMVALEPPE